MPWKQPNPSLTNSSAYLEPRVSNVETSLAANMSLRGTTQNITWNPDGTVQMIQHKDVSNNVLRTDSFTYSTNLITEVRTVGSNTLTFKYHLDTLQTEVI